MKEELTGFGGALIVGCENFKRRGFGGSGDTYVIFSPIFFPDARLQFFCS